MAVDNIDLSKEIKDWKEAVYGKDVRAANVSAFEKIQGAVNETVQNVNQASEDASSAATNAQQAVDDIQGAVETATTKASEAAESASSAATSEKQAAGSATAAASSKEQAAASAEAARKIAEGLGGFDGTAAKVKATDTYGLVVDALGESTAQALIDAIANKVMNELINKNKIVNNLLATDESTVLAGPQGAVLDKRLVAAENAVTQLNSELWPRNSGTEIAPGTDMRTIKTPGRYYCSLTNDALTLTNCPLGEAFTLVVYSAIGGKNQSLYIAQEYTSYFCNRRIIKMYNSYNNAWETHEIQFKS